MGIQYQHFEHYSFRAGENKGDPPASVSSSELDRSFNIENRGLGLATRYGSVVLNVDGSGYPNPIATNPRIMSNSGFSYSSNSYDTIFSAGTLVLRNPTAPVTIATGMTAGYNYQFASDGDVQYFCNGVNNVRYFDPARSLTTSYTAGYGTPAAFNTTPAAAGGHMADGTYEYYVILFDLNTNTRSNPQAASVPAVVAGGGGNGQVTLTNLPLDAESRTSHWIIYRKDPNQYYFFRHVTIAYNASAPTYIDTTATTPRKETIEFNNIRPDVAKVIGLNISQHIMLYAYQNVVTWSKRYRYQDVPTENREILEDNGQYITAIAEFNKATIIWKSSSIYLITGDLNGDYAIRCISKNYGTKSPDTVRVHASGVFFLDQTGRARFLTVTDFSYDDLRDDTDISFKYRKKFAMISDAKRQYCFSIVYENADVSQYWLFAPVDTSGTYCDHVYIFDIGLYKNNQGESAWFDRKYNINMCCATVTGTSTGGYHIHVGDDYGLIWRLNVPSIFYDGAAVVRREGGAALTFGVNTIAVAGAAYGVNQYRGMQVLLYERYTYRELFRSKVVSNTATTFTLQDNIPALTSTDLFLTVGGYLVYFATVNYSRDKGGINTPVQMSVLFDRQYYNSYVQVFTHYDFNQAFNFTYDYLNSSTLLSGTPLADNYDIVLGAALSFYDVAIYGTSSYDAISYDTAKIILRSYYMFNHVSWGVVSREPSQPFGYLGANYYFQPCGDYLGG